MGPNYFNAKIDKTQQNNICRLCGDRDETINHIISECSKLSPREYQSRLNWVGEVIHGELCKKFKFDHTNKWFMQNPESVLEIETHRHLWDLEIQTDHLILARQPDLVIVNERKKKRKKKKRTCQIVDFAVPVYYSMKLKEGEKDIRSWK